MSCARWFSSALFALFTASSAFVGCNQPNDTTDDSDIPGTQVSNTQLSDFRFRMTLSAKSHLDLALASITDLDTEYAAFVKLAGKSKATLDDLNRVRTAWRRAAHNLAQAEAFIFPQSLLSIDGKKKYEEMMAAEYSSSGIDTILADKKKYPELVTDVLLEENDAEHAGLIVGINSLEYLLFGSDDLTLWEDTRRQDYATTCLSIMVSNLTDARAEWDAEGEQYTLLTTETEVNTRARFATALIRQTNRILARAEVYNSSKTHKGSLGQLAGMYHDLADAEAKSFSDLIFAAAAEEPTWLPLFRSLNTSQNALSIAPKLSAEDRTTIILGAVEASGKNVSSVLELIQLAQDAANLLHWSVQAQPLCAAIQQDMKESGATSIHASTAWRTQLSAVGIELDDPADEDAIQKCLNSSTPEDFYQTYHETFEANVSLIRDFLRGISDDSGTSTAALRSNNFFAKESVQSRAITSELTFVVILLQ